MRLDLLPPQLRVWREREVKANLLLASFVTLGVVCLAWQAGLQADRVVVARRVDTLRRVSGQYKLAHDEVRRLEQRTQELTKRLELLAPLTVGEGALAPQIFGSFRRRFPQGVRIAALEVGIDGQVSLEGTAPSFKDVSRLVTWLSREGYAGVALIRARLDGEQRRVAYQVSFQVVQAKEAGKP